MVHIHFVLGMRTWTYVLACSLESNISVYILVLYTVRLVALINTVHTSVVLCTLTLLAFGIGLDEVFPSIVKPGSPYVVNFGAGDARRSTSELIVILYPSQHTHHTTHTPTALCTNLYTCTGSMNRGRSHAGVQKLGFVSVSFIHWLLW